MSSTLKTQEQQASYGIGFQMGEQLKSNPFEGLDLDAVHSGIVDAFSGNASALDPQVLNTAFVAINKKIQAAKESKFKGAVSEGKTYLEENAKRKEITVTESGLQYEILTEGDGDIPSAQNTVRTHYHGTLINGEVFDSSYNRGEPAEFPVGGVIKGWTEALQMMPVGSKWRLHVPYDLAYGERGAGGAIGPYSTLIFDVELLDIVS